MKRFFDFLFSLKVIFILFPLLLIVIIVLSISDEKVIFYKQIRIGKNRKKFKLLKFATMRSDSEFIGNKTVTLRNDPRITYIGKYLRYSKINELPQLFNVFLGDMSFVGPRPLLPNSFAKYTYEVQDVISKLKPGITGIGSLIFRDEEKLVSHFANFTKRDPLEYYKNHIYPYKGALEIWYYHNKSFYTDFMLLILTAISLFSSDSKLVYTIFKNLPPKPKALTLEGIQNL